MKTNHDTRLLQHCICANLPANCTLELAVERTLEFVLKIESLMNDPAALRFLYRSVVSHAGGSGTGPLHAAFSGEMWRQETASTPLPIPAPIRKETAQPGERNDNLLTQKQLARRWSVSQMTLNRWRRDGRLRSHYIGRCVRFKMADVLKFEAEGQS